MDRITELMYDNEWGEYLHSEGQSYFVGECTCNHSQLEHALDSCNTDDCKCEAGWV